MTRPVHILVLILILGLTIIGQTNRGAVSGTVTDTNGAPVPNAKVTITNVGTKRTVVLTTSGDGVYVANSLDPVIYDVLIEAANFKKAIVQKVKVDTATTATVNVSLEPGGISESVTVQADAQMVNAESGTLTQTITERQLRDLPLNNRSVLDLAVTMPNVSGDAGSEDIDAGVITPSPGFNLSVNGGRPGSTLLMADGVNNTGVGIARSVVSFSPETVQEFSVQSSAYSAEYGTTGGGIINITTKTGTNDFRGTALWYHRNPVTNARPWNQGTAPRPANNLRSNQASFTVGGPIFLPGVGDGGKWYYDGRNKSFFFFAWEPRWRNDFTQGTGLLPTMAERTGNFRDVVHTANGWLPQSAITQLNLASTITGDSNIYQRYWMSNGKLLPIIVPTGFQYCPFGSIDSIGVTYDASDSLHQRPYCSAAQASAQIANKGNNPLLDVIPQSWMDPGALKMLANMDPVGNYFLDNGLPRNYFSLRSATQNEDRFTVRIDHNITDKMKANFRWTKTPAVGIRGSGGDINGNTGVYSDASQYLFTVNNIITSNITNEGRFNMTKGNFSEDFSPEFSIMTGRNYSSELGIKTLTTGGMPLFLMNSGNDAQYAGADLGSGLSTNNFNVEHRYEISDTLYWSHGNMLWKIGGSVNRAKLQSTPYFAASGGRWAFRPFQTNNSPTGATSLNNGGSGLASLLIGVPNAVDFRPALFTYNYQWDSANAFVQNDWKVRPNLTLNLGVRYSLQMPRTEANNLQGVFRPDMAQTVNYTDAQRRQIATTAGVQTSDPIPSWIPSSTQIVPFAFSGRGGRSANLVPVDWRVLEPRVGFAWSPRMKIFGWDTSKRDFVLRGGLGLSHAPINGNNRGATPDFGAFLTAGTVNNPTAANQNSSTLSVDLTQPLRINGNNPLQGAAAPLDTLLGTDANGLVFLNAVAIGGVAVNVNDPDYGKVPSSWSWNLAIQFSLFKNSTLEIAYAGNRSVNLYTPQININARDVNGLSTLDANNVALTANFGNDPFGRKTLTGANITQQIASFFTQYMGYEPLNLYFNAKSSSIRHAGYVDFRRRINRGLSLSANYTFSKSMDDSSDASPDVRVLTSGSVKGQTAVGGALKDDWALSAFDTTHVFSTTFTWDLPFGKGRQFFKDAPWYVSGPLGGWTLSGVGRLTSGNPYQPFLTDSNFLSAGSLFNRTVRPDMVEGVPLKNPLWDPKCRVGSAGGTNGGGCEPYVNPAAFMRPAKGELGNAPRTLSIREPMRKYFDLSIQKDFPMPWIGGEGKRKINFRVDFLNLFNIPNFYLNSRGNTPFGFGTFPTEITGEVVNGVNQPITAAEYNTWAAFNGKPLATTTGVPGTPEGNTALAAIRSNINAVRLPARPGQTTGNGALPLNFFSVPVPQGFATTNSLAFNIADPSLIGYKLYRLHQTYDGNFGSLTSGQVGTSFGSPNPGTSARYIQFGIRLIF